MNIQDEELYMNSSNQKIGSTYTEIGQLENIISTTHQ